MMKLSRKKEVIFLLSIFILYLVLIFLPFNFTYDQSILFLFSNTFVLNKINSTRYIVFDLIALFYILIFLTFILMIFLKKKKISIILSSLGIALALMELIFYLIIINRSDNNFDYYNNIESGYNENSLIMYVLNLSIFIFLFVYSLNQNYKDVFLILFIDTIFMLLIPSIGLFPSYKIPVSSGSGPIMIFTVNYKFNYVFAILTLALLSYSISSFLKNKTALKITSIIFLASSLVLFVYSIYKTSPLQVDIGRTVDMYTRGQIYYSLVFVFISLFSVFDSYQKSIVTIK